MCVEAEVPFLIFFLIAGSKRPGVNCQRLVCLVMGWPDPLDRNVKLLQLP